MTKVRRWTSFAAAAVVAASAAVAACGGGNDDAGAGDPPSATIDVGGHAVPVSTLEDAAAALCLAAEEAEADVKVARATFYDRSHDALHTLARALGPADRALAARLLESKERVEAGLAAEPPQPELAADLRRLADVTRAGLAQISVTVPPCS